MPMIRPPKPRLLLTTVTGLPGADTLAVLRIDDFGNEVRLQDMQHIRH